MSVPTAQVTPNWRMTSILLTLNEPNPIAVVIDVKAQAVPKRRTASQAAREGLIPRTRDSRKSNTRCTASVNPITTTSTGKIVVIRLIFTPIKLNKPKAQKLPIPAPATAMNANAQFLNATRAINTATHAPASIRLNVSVLMERKISTRTGGRPVK